MRYLIVGTAGHVDHGKTTLIRAMTGIDTDRLREEKERGISIELGFASMTLPSGRKAGIVDVPGHERFVKHMLAGVGGIDLVLLVIAADEGVMPQTREHLDIIQLLGIEKGIVVLTKIDMVERDWLELVNEEVREYLDGTILKDAPVLHVSGITGEGLKELAALIDRVAEDLPERTTSGPARLPIDRVFSIVGFGTVVTGTLGSGSLRVGDPVEILPSGITSRVRSLQVHGEKVREIGPGHRVAVNITGVEVDEVRRGDVLVSPGSFKPSRLFDVRLYLLKGAGRDLKNRTRIRFHLGSAEIIGRVLLLDRHELEPGEECLAQIVLDEATVAARGDHFVMRSYSPMRTIAGGRIIDPNPVRHRRFREEVISALETLEMGSPQEQVQQVLAQRGVQMTPVEIAETTGLNPDEVRDLCNRMVEEGSVRRFSVDDQDHYLAETRYQSWKDVVLAVLEAFHREYPLREGYPREEMRSRTFPSASPKVFGAMLNMLQADGLIETHAQTVALPGISELPEKHRRVIDQVCADLKAAGIQPGSAVEVFARAGVGGELVPEYLAYMTRVGMVVRVAPDMYFHADTIEEIKQRLREEMAGREEFTLGEVRDLLNSSRKYVLPLLEYFDETRFTKRMGDKRRLAER